MKRKTIFLITFIITIGIIAGGFLWNYYKGTKQEGTAQHQKHVVLIGKNIAQSTDKNGLLSFLANSSAYRVWYIFTDKALENNNPHVVAVEDIMDKEKVSEGIKRLGEKGLPLDKIAYILTFPNTKDALTLQKELHKEFNVNKGWTQDAMEGILAKYRAKGTHGQNEVHLVLRGGEQIAAKAMAYTAYEHKQQREDDGVQGPSTRYETYVELDKTQEANKVDTLIKSAMQFAKEKQYKDGGLTVYFDAKNEIEGVQPFSLLFPALGYRNIFEGYKPSPHASYQARVFCSIQSDYKEKKDQVQWEPANIEEKCKNDSLKAIKVLQDNKAKEIDLESPESVPVGAQVVLYLQHDNRDTLIQDIQAIQKNEQKKPNVRYFASEPIVNMPTLVS